jgi:hypothetical protein
MSKQQFLVVVGKRLVTVVGELNKLRDDYVEKSLDDTSLWSRMEALNREKEMLSLLV